MFEKGNTVIEAKFGYVGLINETFDNWDDLKSKNDFGDLNDDMDNIEKLINGDPKDNWLEVQEIPFTEKQLNERWYSVACFDGGEIWTCESLLSFSEK